jgi:hypothetical protein
MGLRDQIRLQVADAGGNGLLVLLCLRDRGFLFEYGVLKLDLRSLVLVQRMFGDLERSLLRVNALDLFFYRRDVLGDLGFLFDAGKFALELGGVVYV